MRQRTECLIVAALLMVANMGFGQARRVPRQQDRAFRWDSQLGAWVREIPRQIGKDGHNSLGDASPVDTRNNASAPQYTRALDSDQTNSRIDDYIHQDEQINVDPDTGVVKVLRVNQKRLLNDYVVAIVPLENVDPIEVRNVFRNVCGKEGGFADCVRDWVKGENFLQVVCPSFQLPYVVGALKALDESWVQENKDGRGHDYYRPKFRDAAPLLDLLQWFRGPMETYMWDAVANAIQWTGQPTQVARLFVKGTKMCDIPPSQVKLDVAVYEVSVKNDLKLGLDYLAWKNGPGRDLFEGVVAGGPSYIGHFRWVNLHAAVTTAYLDFLASKGKARLAAHSTLTAKSDSIAELAVVDQTLGFNVAHNPEISRYVSTGYTTPPLAMYMPTPPGPILQPLPASQPLVPDAMMDAFAAREDALIPVFHDRVLRYIDVGTVGIFLGVRPIVGLESAELAVTLHATDLDGYTPQGHPLINHRYINSYVRVLDGQPFVLAGLKRKETVKSRNGIPWLSKLPVLGWLVGGETNSRRDVELVVVITPTFDVSSESKIEIVESKIALSEDENAAREFVLGQTTMPLPRNRFGFDQWLLDAIDTY